MIESKGASFTAPQVREAWLFDLFPRGSEMVFWFITCDDQERLRLHQPFQPSGYIGCTDPRQAALLSSTLRKIRSFRLNGTKSMNDFWTNTPMELLSLDILDLQSAWQDLLQLFQKHPDLSYYDLDLPAEQLYACTHRVFPTARCRISFIGDELIECINLETTRDTDYPPVPLRIAHLDGKGFLSPTRAVIRDLTLQMDGHSLEWSFEDPLEAFASINQTLDEWDPDLILTRGGDSFLMPCLFQLASQAGVRLKLDREEGIQRRIEQAGKSYISYGRVVYRDPDYPLWGRWHIDWRNSFLAHESDLDGLIEASRVSYLSVQRMARRSIGTGISSVQIAHVKQNHFPIPWKKNRPEDWKSAMLLLRSDRGGLTYAPPPGVFEEVVELDFVSMYPSIMTHFNVSPETINCSCCPSSSHHVPELGYRICEKRTGLIAESLIPILDKRVEYKQRMKSATDDEERRRWKNRQTALKWMLVCCFGYLGYRNARFGRIEAHESICAFSREMLLRTRRVCEEWDFQILHSLVDCVWLKKRGHSHQQVQDLCREIEQVTSLPIAIEGHYSWLVLLSSTQHPEVPVPARYFGRFEDGTLKYRGIELRRSDQAPFVQEVQAQLLAILSRGDSIQACRALEPELMGVVTEAEQRLAEGQVPVQDLLLRRRISRSAEEYRSNAMTATAVRQAERMGRHLVGGQEVYFLVVDQKSGNPDERIKLVEYITPETRYDSAFYLGQLHRACKTVLHPFLGRFSRRKKDIEIYQELLFEI
ncbi:hypothetical protein L6Q85_09715 [bacterium]|nr:hypothetical protein [bacterium]NUP92106.1 hypothetical protein [Candidatus Omnitrophota bacterium]